MEQNIRTRKLIQAIMLLTVFLLWTSGTGAGTEDGEVLAQFYVKAGEYTRINTPVSKPLDNIPESLPDSLLRLEEVKGSERIPVVSQIEPGHPRKIWWIVTDTTLSGSKRSYELVKGPTVQKPGLKIVTTDSFLQVHHGDAKVLRYHHALVPPPKGAGGKYLRSGFIHPLWSPSQAVLTRIHPADHIHHMGLWNPWTNTQFEGREVDFWNLNKGQGTVRFKDFISITQGPVFSGFQALHEHVDLTAPGGEKVVLTETWDLRVYNSGWADHGYWLIDIVSTMRCATSSPLTLVQYRYGGLGFRATADWKEDNSDYLTSEGKTRKDGHGTRARWCYVHGTTATGLSGVIFMSHPDNHEHPEPMRIWPEGDVFFNFCPIQAADWLLEPGNDYVLRYRLCVFDGATTPERIDRLWQDFGKALIINRE